MPRAGAERGRAPVPRAGENTEVVTSPKVTRRRAPGDGNARVLLADRALGDRESDERDGEARAGLGVRLSKPFVRRGPASTRLPLVPAFSALRAIAAGRLTGLRPLASDAADPRGPARSSNTNGPASAP